MWGNRLRISQVSQRTRNSISIPLDSVVQFRDRLDDVINSLELDKQSAMQKKLLSSVNGDQTSTLRRARSEPSLFNDQQSDREDGFKRHKKPTKSRNQPRPILPRPILHSEDQGRESSTVPTVVHDSGNKRRPQRRRVIKGTQRKVNTQKPPIINDWATLLAESAPKPIHAT